MLNIIVKYKPNVIPHIFLEQLYHATENELIRADFSCREIEIQVEDEFDIASIKSEVLGIEELTFDVEQESVY